MSHLYQVTVKGRNLIELKKAVENLYKELTGGILTNGPEATIVKDLDAQELLNMTNYETEEDDDTQFDESLSSKHLPQQAVVNEPTHTMTGELDSKGQLWDASLHSSSKAKNKDGSWKARRNVNAVQAPVEVPPVVQAPVAQQVVTPPPPVYQAPPVAQAPVTPPVAPQPQMTNGYTQEMFVANFPLILSQLITAGKITQEYIESCKAYFKVIEIWNIVDAQKIEMFNNIVQYNIIAKVG